MKKNILFALTAIALLLLPMYAKAANERGIALTSHKCLLCDKTYYTFKPDSIDCAKSETRTRRFQAANWFIFKGKRMIPACPKADGAHIFQKGSDILVDPAGVVKRSEYIVYNRNSGGSLQAQLVRMKCIGCGMEAFAFACDDLDYEKPIDLKKANTWVTMENQRPKTCNWLPAWSNGNTSIYHFMKDVGNTSISSRDLAAIMNKVICSRP